MVRGWAASKELTNSRVCANSSGCRSATSSQRMKALGTVSTTPGRTAARSSAAFSGPVSVRKPSGRPSARMASIPDMQRACTGDRHIRYGSRTRSTLPMVICGRACPAKLCTECSTSFGTPVVPELWVTSCGVSSRGTEAGGTSPRGASCRDRPCSPRSPTYQRGSVASTESSTPADSVAASVRMAAGAARPVMTPSAWKPTAECTSTGTAPTRAQAKASSGMSKLDCLTIRTR